MAVLLTVSGTLDGVQIAESLSGGSTGTDLDQATNGQFTPVTPPASNNVGRQDWYIRSDATVDQITDVKVYMDEYSGIYGGPASRSAAADYVTLKTEGSASGSNKTNGDGLSGGIWMEQSVLQMITGTNQFDQGARPTEVKIFGDAGTDGIDLGSAYVLNSASMVIDSDQGNGGDGSNGFIPNSPVSGEIGIDGDIALGDNCHIGMRAFIRSAFANGGIFQFDITIVYTFTA